VTANVAAGLRPVSDKETSRVVRVLASPDRRAFLERLGGEEGLLHEAVRLFDGAHPALLARVQQAVERHDAVGLEQAAHALKGMVRNFGHSSAAELAHRLEHLGRSANLEGADALFVELEVALRQLQAVLTSWLSAPERIEAAEGLPRSDSSAIAPGRLGGLRGGVPTAAEWG
jgi:HPt (histidine-containing phosphotransfer) domain-containing protein